MARVTVRFYATLNDHLRAGQRGQDVPFQTPGVVTPRTICRMLGVPTAEVDYVLVDGEPASFDDQVPDGVRCSLYPRFLHLRPDGARQPALPETPRFVLDVHLGKLARHLRLFGFDALHRDDYDDRTLARLSDEERRILLTRDRGLLMRRRVWMGAFVRSEEPAEQVVEVGRRFGLAGSVAPFTRCLVCNGDLARVPAEAVRDEVPDDVSETFETFFRCAQCERVYWKGSHFERMQTFVERVRARI